MNNNMKTVIKILGIIICIFLLVIIGYFIITMNKTNNEENAAPDITVPVKENVAPIAPKPEPKPVINRPITRDENNMPKSDYKVPEIG